VCGLGVDVLSGADRNRGVSSVDRNVWDRHWAALAKRSSLFGRLASLVRKQLLSRAVPHYASSFFPDGGIFVEAGCGTAQSSSRLTGTGRRLVALDFSLPALREARRVAVFKSFVQADILMLPFRANAVAGIWNLGVMEHFEPPAGQRILEEFRRVLKPGAVALLFWPPEFGASRLVLAPIEAVVSLFRKAPFRFFPDEVNRLRSREHARRMLRQAEFETAAVELTPRDLFIHLVVVARKPVA
jgi:SAM-dependent methyltransferase